MGMQGRRKITFSLDTNFLWDLGEGLDFAHSLREELLELGNSLQVAPTVVTELALFAHNGSSRERRVCTAALKSMRGWQIKPFDLIPAGHGITEQCVDKLIAARLLPASERNDGFILAETALAGIEVLITNDHHLADIPPAALKEALKVQDLESTVVARPRDVWRAFCCR